MFDRLPQQSHAPLKSRRTPSLPPKLSAHWRVRTLSPWIRCWLSFISALPPLLSALLSPGILGAFQMTCTFPHDCCTPPFFLMSTVPDAGDLYWGPHSSLRWLNGFRNKPWLVFRGQKWWHFCHTWCKTCLVCVQFSAESYHCTLGLCGPDGIPSIHIFMHWNNFWSDLLLAHVLTTFKRVMNSSWSAKTEQSVGCLVASARWLNNQQPSCHSDGKEGWAGGKG